MGAGLRPEAKAADEPPDPTVRAPVLDPTGGGRRRRGQDGYRADRPPYVRTRPENKAKRPPGPRKTAQRVVNAIACRVPDSSEETVPQSGSPALLMIQGRREIRLPRFAGEISVDPGANRTGFIESAGEPK